MTLDLMIDLETLDNTPNAAIVQVGVALFVRDGQGVAARHSILVNPDDYLVQGGSASFSTIQWWMTQDEHARTSVFGPAPRVSTYEALASLATIWQTRCDPEKSFVWAAPASFDLAIVALAGRKVCNWRETPWPFRRQRCSSTLGKMLPGFRLDDVPTPPEFSVKHDAGADAARQAIQVQAMMHRLADVHTAAKMGMDAFEAARSK